MQHQLLSLKALVVSSVLATAVAASAQTPSTKDLVGSWNLNLTSPQGTHTAALTIRDEAGQLSGTVSGEMGSLPVAVRNSEAGVSLSFTVDYQGQPLPIVLTGKLADGALAGMVDYGNGAAQGDFTARKGVAAAEGASATTAGPSLTGTWVIASDGGPGWSMALTQEGTVVTGTLMNAERGVSLPLKGKVSGGTLELAISGEASGTITGTLEASALKGSYDVDGNAGSWSATRKP